MEVFDFKPGTVYKVLQKPADDLVESLDQFEQGELVRFEELKYAAKLGYASLLFKPLIRKVKFDYLVIQWFESEPEPKWEDFFLPVSED